MDLIAAIIGGLAMAAANTCPVELVVLGTAQDGGAPQIGHDADPAWADPSLRRTATSLGVVDRASGKRWLFDATPDLREQLHRFDQVAPAPDPNHGLDGVFLTHAHMGHYTGLMFFGHESMGAKALPVWAMPRMADYLTTNGPWSQLVRYGNIALKPLADRRPVDLGAIAVTPLLVPHRQEFSEVVGFRIQGPNRSALFIPDIDSWEQWDAAGVRIEEEIAKVDVAWLDATFYAQGELPGRDMSKVPHPLVTHSMTRFAALPAAERSKVRFIHLNHTNPARFPDSEARRAVEAAGFRVAEEMERLCL
ncbi:MAG TPA: MBL fold metallo-hydrolase [Caulobacteraceae bacterium]|nr:MBL fold metallo-hydrolase [Caulobacteraceae bacterium]